jgi:hypothetical protein
LGVRADAGWRRVFVIVRWPVPPLAAAAAGIVAGRDRVLRRRARRTAYDTRRRERHRARLDALAEAGDAVPLAQERVTVTEAVVSVKSL